MAATGSFDYRFAGSLPPGLTGLVGGGTFDYRFAGAIGPLDARATVVITGPLLAQASGASVSSGTATPFLILLPGATGASTSSGTADIRWFTLITATGASTSSGTAQAEIPQERVTEILTRVDTEFSPYLYRVTEIILRVDAWVRRRVPTEPTIDVGIFDPGGFFYGMLNDADVLRVEASHMTQGAGEVQVHIDAVSANLLDVQRVIKVRVGGVDVYAFIVEEIEDTLVAREGRAQETRVARGRGLYAFFDYALVFPNMPSEPDKRVFTNKLVGEILYQLMDEAWQRGCTLPYPTFSPTADTGGNPWPRVTTDARVGDSLFQFIRHLQALAGFRFFVQPTMVVDAHLLSALSTTPKVILIEGKNLIWVRRQRTMAELSTAVLVRGDANTYREQVYSEVNTYGRVERFIDFGRTTDTSVLSGVADAYAGERRSPKEVLTVAAVPGWGEMPWVDYNVGDYVYISAQRRGIEGTYRVNRIVLETPGRTGRVEEATVYLTLGDPVLGGELTQWQAMQAGVAGNTLVKASGIER